MRSQLVLARDENRGLAVRLSEEQIATKKFHDEFCCLQSKVFSHNASVGLSALLGSSATGHRTSKNPPGVGPFEAKTNMREQTNALESQLREVLDLVCFSEPVVRVSQGIYEFGPERVYLRLQADGHGYASRDDVHYEPMKSFVMALADACAKQHGGVNATSAGGSLTTIPSPPASTNYTPTNDSPTCTPAASYVVDCDVPLSTVAQTAASAKLSI
jgi:hypothetical protein